MSESSIKNDTIQRHKPYSDDPPSIEIDYFDASPFSMSFSGMLDEDSELGELGQDVDLSFSIEQITDLKEIDPEWDDEEIDELVILSPKMPNRLSTIMEDLQELDKKATSIFTLSDFDLISESEDGTRTCLIRKRGTKRTYTMNRFKTTSSHTWPLELSVLEMINDREAPFLPKICWRVFEEGCFSLIMNSYPGGSLLHYVEKNGPLSGLHAVVYASELVEALSVIHAAGIQHRNISPASIMIDATGHIVLVGFEQTYVDTDDAIASGTVRCPKREHEYRAPELVLGWTHDYAVDCWGFGYVLYFMMYGMHPFPVDIGGFDWQEKVIRGQALYQRGQVPQVARELMRACMEPNPAFRLDILEIKGHDFFASVNWSLVHEKNSETPYVPLSEFATKSKSASIASVETIRKPGSISSTIPQSSTSDWNVQTQTPAPAYTVSPSPSTSLKARKEVQDLLPSIFRIGQERKPDESQPLLARSSSSTVETACSLDPANVLNVSYTSLPSPAPTYDSLRRRLDNTPSLTQEERMARFWESLDNDIKMKSPDMACRSGELPYMPRSLAFRRSQSKLRKKFDFVSASRSSVSLVTSSTQRLSQLITGKTASATVIPPSDLQHTLRKHKSSPILIPSDSTESEGSKLPRGLEQIGSGIGFTYRPPPIPLPLSTPVHNVMSRSRMLRPMSGFGIRLGLKAKVGVRKSRWVVPMKKRGSTEDMGFGGSSRKSKENDTGDVVIGRMSSSSFVLVSGQKSSLDSGRGRCTDERRPQHDVDVFQVGLLPDAEGEEAVSPVTEADSTVKFDSPTPDTGTQTEFMNPNVLGSETLKGLFRDHGVLPTLRLVL